MLHSTGGAILSYTYLLVVRDNRRTARAVADRVGVRDVHAEVTPHEKLQAVRSRQNTGLVVAFVGDGINDAPALAAADVVITLATAADVAVGAADLTIIHDDLRRIPEAIHLARRSVRVIKQNLFGAFLYKLAERHTPSRSITQPSTVRLRVVADDRAAPDVS